MEDEFTIQTIIDHIDAFTEGYNSSEIEKSLHKLSETNHILFIQFLTTIAYQIDEGSNFVFNDTHREYAAAFLSHFLTVNYEEKTTKIEKEWDKLDDESVQDFIEQVSIGFNSQFASIQHHSFCNFAHALDLRTSVAMEYIYQLFEEPSIDNIWLLTNIFTRVFKLPRISLLASDIKEAIVSLNSVIFNMLDSQEYKIALLKYLKSQIIHFPMAPISDILERLQTLECNTLDELKALLKCFQAIAKHNDPDFDFVEHVFQMMGDDEIHPSCYIYLMNFYAELSKTKAKDNISTHIDAIIRQAVAFLSQYDESPAQNTQEYQQLSLVFNDLKDIAQSCKEKYIKFPFDTLIENHFATLLLLQACLVKEITNTEFLQNAFYLTYSIYLRSDNFNKIVSKDILALVFKNHKNTMSHLKYLIKYIPEILSIIEINEDISSLELSFNAHLLYSITIVINHLSHSDSMPANAAIVYDKLLSCLEFPIRSDDPEFMQFLDYVFKGFESILNKTSWKENAPEISEKIFSYYESIHSFNEDTSILTQLENNCLYLMKSIVINEYLDYTKLEEVVDHVTNQIENQTSPAMNEAISFIVTVYYQTDLLDDYKLIDLFLMLLENNDSNITEEICQNVECLCEKEKLEEEEVMQLFNVLTECATETVQETTRNEIYKALSDLVFYKDCLWTMEHYLYFDDKRKSLSKQVTLDNFGNPDFELILEEFVSILVCFFTVLRNGERKLGRDDREYYEELETISKFNEKIKRYEQRKKQILRVFRLLMLVQSITYRKANVLLNKKGNRNFLEEVTKCGDNDLAEKAKDINNIFNNT